MAQFKPNGDPLPVPDPAALAAVEADALRRVALSRAEMHEGCGQTDEWNRPTPDDAALDLALAARWRRYSESLRVEDAPETDASDWQRVIEDEMTHLAFDGRDDQARELQADPARRWRFVQGAASVLHRLAEAKS